MRFLILLISASLYGFHPVILKEEFVFTKAPFASCHASTLTETADGHILCAYFGGTDEGKSDVAIWLSSRDDEKWSEPRQIAHVQNNPCWNPVLFTMPTGEILLFYKGGPSPQNWSGFLKRSHSEGKDWSEPEFLPAGIYGPVRSKPLLLEDGTLLCGSSTESWRRWGSFIDITQDGGSTWTKSCPINLKESVFGVIQPTFFLGKEGEIFVALRSLNTGAICVASSLDCGRTWSDAEPIDLPNPNAAVEALTLEDGRSLLIFNDSKTERSPLSIATSVDGGETWEKVLNLEEGDGEFSYPAAIQSSDGLVHITYTYNRVKIKHVAIAINQ